MRHVIFVLILAVLMPSTASSSSLAFSFDEANSFLQTLSRLGPVTVVEKSRFLRMNSPHICWVNSDRLSAITPALLANYEGDSRWTLIADVPRVCLTVQPDFRRVQRYFSSYGPSDEHNERSLGGVQHPSADQIKKARQFIEEFRSEMVTELPKLAAYIQKTLDLQNSPSLGFTFSNETFELPHLEDRAGPGGSIVLTANPSEFVRTGLPVSALDRSVHFWLTEEESNELGLEVSKFNQESGSTQPDDSLLLMVAQSGYGGLVIEPNKVAELRKECTTLQARTTNRLVQSALQTLLSICGSADYYHLGIYIPGQ